MEASKKIQQGIHRRIFGKEKPTFFRRFAANLALITSLYLLLWNSFKLVVLQLIDFIDGTAKIKASLEDLSEVYQVDNMMQSASIIFFSIAFLQVFAVLSLLFFFRKRDWSVWVYAVVQTLAFIAPAIIVSSEYIKKEVEWIQAILPLLSILFLLFVYFRTRRVKRNELSNLSNDS